MSSFSRLFCMSLVLAGSGALASACGDDDAPSAQDSSSVRGLDLAAFDESLAAFVASKQLAGATAVVVHKDHGIVHKKAYGSFALERQSAIASTSKILSVGVLMRLADQGLLDLDTDVSTYLSAWGEHKPGVTTASLLSNSSGLVSLTDNPVYAPYFCQYTSLDGTLADCARSIYAADDADTLRPPDTEFHYGGGQWQLAGGLAEVVSKKSWAELVRETYVEPCGAASLGFANHYAQGGLLGALTYPPYLMGDASVLTTTQNPSIEGGAYINALDYGKLLLMHLRGGKCDDTQVLSPSAVTRMQEDRIAKVYQGSTPQPTLQGYGMGWWVDRAHPGVVSDPGAFGAVAWLDNPRGYGAIIIIESTQQNGAMMFEQVKPSLDGAFDALAKE